MDLAIKENSCILMTSGDNIGADCLLSIVSRCCLGLGLRLGTFSNALTMA